MLKKIIRVLAWLLIVALPVQGVAATAMLHCGPGHHGSADTPVAGAHHDDVGAVSHAHELTEPTTDPRHHPDEEAQPPVADPSGFAKCSVCATCCLGAGFPMGRRADVISPPHFLPLLSAVVPVLEIFVPGPERPPRYTPA